MRPAAGRLTRRPFRSLLAPLVLLAAALAGPAPDAGAQPAPPQRWDGAFELISGGRPYAAVPLPANAPTRLSGHNVSADGRFVFFSTDATNMGYSGPAVYFLDRRLNYPSPVAFGRDAAISADGNHYVTQTCWGGGTDCDLYAVDRRTDTSSKLTLMPDGTSSLGTSSQPVLSTTGRYVVFLSKAGNITGAYDGIRQVIFRDRDPDGNGVYDEPGSTVEVITAGGDADSDTAEVSADGRFVAFRSRAGNLVPGDAAGTWDVFLRDRQTGETRRLNVQPGGDPSPFEITEAHISMSADGRYVAFASADPMLVTLAYGDTNDGLDVFVYDRQAAALSRIDVGRVSGAIVPGNGPSSWPTLSADGRYVSLQSSATDVDVPPPAGTTQVYVFDRVLGQPRRISVMQNGANPDQSSYQPAISGDGSLVLFQSTATTFLSIAPPAAPQVIAASYLSIGPAEVRIPGGGGTGTFTVSAHPHTRWWPIETPDVSWLTAGTSPVPSIGSGSVTVTVSAPNPNPQTRVAALRVAQASLTATQDAGLSVTSVAPAQGPIPGGTLVTITGTNLETATVTFGGRNASWQSRTPTTIVVWSPSRSTNPRSVDVTVRTSDGRTVTIPGGFYYTGDDTPPLLSGAVTGPMGQNGWYVGPVSITWTMSDPESTITSTTCNNVTYGSDTALRTVSCTATSEGGTSSASVSYKRDTLPPTITVTSPVHGAVVAAGEVVPGTYTCSDTLSGVATCGSGTPSGTPIDTAATGLKSFTTTATDAAGNVQTVDVPYGVGTGVCSAPPTGMKSWLRMEGNLVDSADGLNTASPYNMSAAYAAGEVGQGFNFANRTWGNVEVVHGTRLAFSNRLSIAFWMRPTSPYLGTLVRFPGQLKIDYVYNDRIAWVMDTPLQPSGWSTIGDGSIGRAPVAAWTHVVLTFDSGELRLYLDGRLDRAWTGLQASLMPFSIGTPVKLGEGPNGYVYVGRLDEVQLFDRALGAGEISGLYLAGTSGVCPPSATTLEAPPVTTTYGAGSFEATAILRDAAGAPMPGKTIAMRDTTTARTANLTTDAAGTVRWNVPFTLAAGAYPTAIRATYNGEPAYAASTATAAVTVQKATPVITWPTPAPITYGTPLSAAQLNATASVGGTITYTPASGTVLDAGLRPLQASFAPTNSQNYNATSTTVTLDVRKAVPTINLTAGTFLYDGQPHAATATVTGVGGATLGPVTVTYDESADAPVAAGVYAVAATFAGDANHEARTATGTLTIDPFTPVVTVAGGTFTYDAQPHATTATVTGVGADVPPGTLTITYNGSTTVPAGAGTYAVTASIAAAGNYRAASATATLTILKAASTVSLQVTPATFDGQPHPAVATATGANGASLSPVTITYDGSPAVPLNGGVYAVAASFDGDANHLPASATATLIIAKAVPVLAWSAPAPITYGTPLSAAQLNATSSAAGTFAYEPPAGSVLVSGVVHPLTATFTPAEPRNYEAGTVSTTIVVEQAPATVTVTGGAYTYDGQPHEASASATGVGGAPLAPVSVTYNGVAAAPVAAGSYEVVATFAGDANHAAASATATITIGKAPAALSWNPPAAISYGTPLSATQLNATADVAGTFVYTPAAGTLLGATAAHTLTATFTPADARNYDGGTVSTSIAVERAVATVTVTGGSVVYDGQPHAATASVTGAGGEDLGAATLTYNGSATVPSAAGTYTVVASYAGSINYAPSSQSTTLTIGKATPVLSWTPPAPLPYGPTLGPTQLNAQASVAGTFSYAPGVGNRLPAGTHTLTATFTPADPANYVGGTVSTSITIVPAALEIRTVDTIKAFSSSLPMFTATFTGLASGQTIFNLSGTLTFATAATATSPVGTYAVTPGGLSSPNYVITYVSGTLTVVKVPVSLTLAASPTPSGLDMPITFAATVSGTQGVAIPAGVVRFLDGGTLLGTATLSNGMASLLTGGLTAGSHTIEARFDGDASFEAGTIAATHVVNTAAATPAITIASSRQPASNGQAVTLTATITVATSGTIGFYDGNTLLGTGSIASGAATLTTGFAAGSHAITARFQGNASAPPVISPVFVQSVTNGGSWKDRTSSLGLVSSSNPSTLGSTVTFTATASGSSGTPAGRILFMVDGLIVGDPNGVAVSGSGQASVSISALNGGRHKVTATYLGSSNYRGSNGALTQTVN